MRIYKVVHTGPKSQFGGLKDGLTKPAYHVGIEGNVNNDPINPANKQAPIETSKFRRFIYFLTSVFQMVPETHPTIYPATNVMTQSMIAFPQSNDWTTKGLLTKCREKIKSRYQFAKPTMTAIDHTICMRDTVAPVIRPIL